MQLGAPLARVYELDWRGTTDQGTQLKVGGSSGMNLKLGGYRQEASGGFNNLLNYGRYWTSSESGIAGWTRHITSTDTGIARVNYMKGFGFSVRCVGN